MSTQQNKSDPGPVHVAHHKETKRGFCKDFCSMRLLANKLSTGPSSSGAFVWTGLLPRTALAAPPLCGASQCVPRCLLREQFTQLPLVR